VSYLVGGLAAVRPSVRPFSPPSPSPTPSPVPSRPAAGTAGAPPFPGLHLFLLHPPSKTRSEKRRWKEKRGEQPSPYRNYGATG
jgi:hypothetical protein